MCNQFQALYPMDPMSSLCMIHIGLGFHFDLFYQGISAERAGIKSKNQ